MCEGKKFAQERKKKLLDAINLEEDSLEFLDHDFLVEMNGVMKQAFETSKYEKDDYKSRPYDYWKKRKESLDRHIANILLGTHIDSESGLRHIAHAACNIMIMAYHLKTEQARQELSVIGQLIKNQDNEGLTEFFRNSPHLE